MNQQYEVEKDNFEQAGMISSQIKRTLKQIGFQPTVLRRIAVACYEAEINMIIHSYGGVIGFEIEDNGDVILSFKDIGPGIQDIPKAMEKGYSTANDKARALGFGAGMGLFNIKQNCDVLDIQSCSEGTHLKMRFNYDTD